MNKNIEEKTLTHLIADVFMRKQCDAVNDAIYDEDKPVQLELDFGDAHLLEDAI